ncbi:efflux RND transporter periplasmic adaptor subunit [Leptothoe sp. LEGE 181152]|uniref:Efflux RND transporter periplasmic adaptor subunit n=1 Tax=Adonisia turfae CCMR0081 TaxID=2292702 RepID=A0A6M0REI2_9CYAN|nr:efflux RND transporter periplasmic adaptor subunit [Adonisia turfae]MDV3353144.1 efflux RND transporter periplasmic adaptor subunit [Leptothoe sp. LEGE 181152]NEZ54647.1 efflux RND transporter periplasmic adaptor subunit [Adonisia turfae CCMR0081]
MQSSSVSSQVPSQRNWLIWLATLIVLAGGGFALWLLLGRGGGPSGMPMGGAVPVTIEQMRPETLRDQATFVGTLDAQAGVVLQPEADGRITRIYVSSGDQIAAGDPIMELSADRSQAELSAALASVSAAQSARDNSRAQLQSLVAQRIRIEADVKLQNTEFGRTQRLVEAGAQSQQELDEVERDRDAAIASLEAATEEIEAAQASLSQAEAFLEQSQATAEATREDLLDKTVTAPIAGVVGDIPVELGDYVQVGGTLTTITQNEVLELEIDIPAEQLGEIQLGMPVELLTFGAGEPVATGALSFISPQTDVSTQTVLAKARFSNLAGNLQDNQRVDVRVILDERPGLLIPATAITRLGGQSFVYVAADAPPPEDGQPPIEGPVAQLRPVTLGAMQGNNFQVLEGLSAGEEIVTTGLLNLQDGVPITPQEEAAEAGVSP